jgi:hypothetical protein
MNVFAMSVGPGHFFAELGDFLLCHEQECRVHNRVLLKHRIRFVTCHFFCDLLRCIVIAWSGLLTASTGKPTFAPLMSCGKANLM